MFWVLILLGMFMDGVSMMLISVPIFFPLAQHLGFDPIWFGLFMLLTIEMGGHDAAVRPVALRDARHRAEGHDLVPGRERRVSVPDLRRHSDRAPGRFPRDRAVPAQPDVSLAAGNESVAAETDADRKVRPPAGTGPSTCIDACRAAARFSLVGGCVQERLQLLVIDRVFELVVLRPLGVVNGLQIGRCAPRRSARCP